MFSYRKHDKMWARFVFVWDRKNIITMTVGRHSWVWDRKKGQEKGRLRWSTPKVTEIKQ